MSSEQNQEPATSHFLNGFRIDISHQEMSRICEELEKFFMSFAYNDEGPTGLEWMPVRGTDDYLCESLGYEDIDELEDALKGSLVDFLKVMPHINMEQRGEKWYWGIKPDPPREEWNGVELEFTVSSREDLWRVLFKNHCASIEVPCCEFSINASGRRTIDSIYNHFSQSIYNLGDYIRGSKNSDEATAILQTVEELENLLDLEKEFKIIIRDPSGMSEISPADGVVRRPYTPE